MKHLAVLLLAAGSTFAADFVTGQAARAVIGQPYFGAEACADVPDQTTPGGGCDPSLVSHPANNVLLGGAAGIAYANGMLFVADANRANFTPINNRVLIYRSLHQQLPKPSDELNLDARCPLCVGTADVVLGQTDFTGTGPSISDQGLNLPTAVASDGVHLAVADTNNNRVLIWNSIPAGNNQPADVVIGQPDFTSNCPNTDGKAGSKVPSCPGGTAPSASSLRGPQGVWLQNGKLFVADDLNHRVLIWNQIPAKSFAPADVVLGQPNFTSATMEPQDLRALPTAAANTLLNPVSVTSDGVRLFVSDLGNNRVLIWNSIPTQNQQAADIVLGQPNMTTGIPNYTGDGGVCPSNGTDSTSGKATYPQLCSATLNFPRFALSDGTRLFIADGGNDRVLIYDQVPTQNAAAADHVLGQFSDILEQTSDSIGNPDVARRGATDAIRTPMSLAWDGTNLYVSEPPTRRVLVFTPSDNQLPITAVRNAASMEVYAIGRVSIGGTITEKDKVTVKIRDTEYSYTVQKDDTIDHVVNGLVAAINANAGDPWVLASADIAAQAIELVSRVGGTEGNNTALGVTTAAGSSSATPTITATASGASLSGGQNAAKVAPGTLVAIFGNNLADTSAAAPSNSDPLPNKLGGVEVYIDGIRAPLLSVSPTQINAQFPWAVNEAAATSASAYVRTEHADGTVTFTTAVGVPAITANPGIFAYGGADPRPAIMVHGSSSATGTILIDGSAKSGDVVSVTIGDNTYTYTLTADDTLATVRDQLIGLINASDPNAIATAGGAFTRIRLSARLQGPAGEGLPISASDTGGNVIMGTTHETLCCSNVAGSMVTPDNPAVPGEVVVIYATGLGIVQPDAENLGTGFSYKGPELNQPIWFVSSLAGGRTANVLYAGLKPGSIGVYEVDLELNTGLPTEPNTQLTIAQDIYVSNIVTFPVVANAAPQP